MALSNLVDALTRGKRKGGACAKRGRGVDRQQKI